MVCCFIGHREIDENEALRHRVEAIVLELVTKRGVDTFLFGSKSRFNDLCYEIVSEMKEKYPHIKRIYVRSAFMDILEDYRNYLLERYEDTIYPDCVKGAKRASYIKRNQYMIQKSDICVFYYHENYQPPKRKNGIFDHQPQSGTGLAYDYAVAKGKEVIRTD